MKNDRKNNRKVLANFKFNHKFQVQLLIYVVCLFAVLEVFNLVSSVLLFSQIDILIASNDNIPIRFYSEYLQHKNNTLFIQLAGSIFVLATLSVGLLFLSNKIAGPLIRLNEHIKSITDPDVPIRKMEFRLGDHLEELEANFNRFLDRFEKK